MQTDLEKLLDVQAKDLVLLEVDLRLSALLREVATLDEEVRHAADEVSAAKAAHAEISRRQRELERRIEGYRTLQEHRRSRMEQVKNAREAQALMTEMEMARTVLMREEGEWLKVAEQGQAAEARVAAATAEHDRLTAAQEAMRADLAGRQAELEAERRDALEGRNAAAAALDKGLRLRYDRLRANREGAVVVAVRGVACGACFTAVPMSRRNQLREGLLIEGCEACGVILYAEEVFAG
jgi:predicted  nucleic acid-binding Zn-ribbon protein